MFFELCDSVYLRPEAEGGRFGIYENRIRRLVNHIEAIGCGEPEGPLFAQIAPDLPVYLTALTESLEVGEITPFLSSCPRDLLVPRLKAVLRGPVLPSDENQSSNQARNIQFELYLAALLSRSGVSVSFGEPDLHCEIGNLTCFVACKRILSTSKLNKRINEATEQLGRAVAPLPEAGGVIAVSLSSAMAKTDGKSESIASREAGLTAMSSRIDEFIDRHKARWQQTREAQAILFHLSSMFTNTGTGRIESGRFIVLRGTGPLCEALAEKLDGEAEHHY